MIKFTKVREGVGDYVGFDPTILAKELSAFNIGISTNSNEIKITFNNQLDNTQSNIDAITTIVKSHGLQVNVDARVLTTKHKVWENEMVSKLREYYSQDEEYKMLRLGLLDITDILFVQYNNRINALKSDLTTAKISNVEPIWSDLGVI